MARATGQQAPAGPDPHTRDEIVAQAYDVIAVPATSIARGLDTEVQIGVADGMPIECVLNVANTLSADKAFLTERITALGSSTMSEVCRALNAATSC